MILLHILWKVVLYLFNFILRYPIPCGIALLISIALMSCSHGSSSTKKTPTHERVQKKAPPCPYEYVLRCPPNPDIRTADLPFTWRDLDNLESVSQGCFDGKLSYQLSKLSDKMSQYLKKRYANFQANASTIKEQSIAYKPEAQKYLNEHYQVIDHPWTKTLNILVDDLLTYVPGDFSDLEMTVYIVKNKDGSDFFNVVTIPSLILFGEEYLKLLLTFNEGDDLSPSIAGIVHTLGHELGHRILDVSQEDNRKYALIHDNSKRFGKIGKLLTSKTLEVVENPFQKREEILCDHFSLLLLSETKRIDMVDALEADRWLALVTDKDMQDKYLSELMRSHPSPITRSMCKNHLIISHLND